MPSRGGPSLTLIGGLLAVPLLLLGGAGVLPSAKVIPRGLWENAGLAWLAGCALFAVFGTLGLAFGVPFPIIAAVAVAGCLFSGWKAWKRGDLEDCRRTPTLLGRGWVLLLAILGLGSAALTLALPINAFDPLLHFAYKGKILFHHGSPTDQALMGMAGDSGLFGRMVTHPNYPLGVPLLEAFAAWLGGGWNDRWVQFPLAFWAAALPAVVFFGLRHLSLATAKVGALVAASVPMLYVRDFLAEGTGGLAMAGLGNTSSLGGWGDLPIAALLAGGCGLLLRARTTPCKRAAMVAGLLVAGGACMKNEGLAMAGVFALALLFSGALLLAEGEAKARRVTWFALAALLVGVLPWLILRSSLPSIDENYLSHFQPDRIAHFLGGGAELVEKAPKVMVGQAPELLANPPERRMLVPGYFGEEIFDFRSWGLLWPLVFIALFAPSTRKDPNQRWLALLVIGGLLLYALILLVTPWYLPLLRDKGIPERLMLHLVGPASMIVAAWWARPSSPSSTT